MKNLLRGGAAALAAASLLSPNHAFAALGAGGGGMPYSAGLNTFSQSIQGEVAFLILLIAIVLGVGGWVMSGQNEAMFMHIGRVMIGAGIIGGVVAFLGLAGVTGAVI